MDSLLVVGVTVLLYGGTGVWLMTKGWPIRAGLVIALISLLPLTWQANFTDSDAPGFAFLQFVMLLIPFCLIAYGLILLGYRGYRRITQDGRNAKAERDVAWRAAIEMGPDGFTGFERDAIAAIEAIAGRLSCERSGRIDRPTLSARIPVCDLVLTLWGEDAQLQSVDGKSIYRKERWDFATPQESIRDLTKTVASVIAHSGAADSDRR